MGFEERPENSFKNETKRIFLKFREKKSFW